jgi:hypothetical protein
MNAFMRIPKPVLIIGGLGIYASTTLAVYNYYDAQKNGSGGIGSSVRTGDVNKNSLCVGCEHGVASKDREATYGKIANKYDSGRGDSILVLRQRG